MAFKAKMDELLSDVKSTMPMFKLSPARKIVSKDGEQKKDEKIKTRFLETWNNLRYDFGSEAYLKKDIPIWILGVCHHSRGEDFILEERIMDDSDDEYPEFVTALAKEVFTDFASRPWFTYRKQFPPIPGTNITSDTGWGCMLRSVQMVIAQGLFQHYLGRDWRWMETQDHHSKHLHRKILGWFIDDPGEHCPLSIHHLSQIGRKYGVLPGNWYGPNTVAYIMQQAVESAKEKITELRDIVVYVAQDCTVYADDVYDLCGWTKDSVFDLAPPANRTCSDTESTESMSSESSVYVDEIAAEVSEITKFSAPKGVELTQKNINNMILMDEFVSSTDINPEVTIGAQWTKPRKNSPYLKKKLNKNWTPMTTLVTEAKSKTVRSHSANDLTSSKPMDRVANSEPNNIGQNATENLIVDENEPLLSSYNLAGIPAIIVAHSEPGNAENMTECEAMQSGHIKVADDTSKTEQNVESSQQNSKNKDAFVNEAPVSTTNSKIRHMFKDLLTKPSDSTNALKNEQNKTTGNTITNSESSISSMFSNTFNTVLSKWNSTQTNSILESSTVTPEPEISDNTTLCNTSNNPQNSNSLVEVKQAQQNLENLSKLNNVAPGSEQIECTATSSKKSYQVQQLLPEFSAFNEQNQSGVTLSKGLKLTNCADQKAKISISNTEEVRRVEDSNLPSLAPSSHCEPKRDPLHEFSQLESNDSNVHPTPHLEKNPSVSPAPGGSLKESFHMLDPSLEDHSSSNNSGIPHPEQHPEGITAIGGSLKEADPSSKGTHHNLSQESGKKLSDPSSVIILIPVRLGESTLNPIYIPCIKAMLSLKSSIGIIGGKPKHSLYFVGYQGDNLLHLDPHYCQVADTSTGYKKNLQNYHTMSVRKTNVKKIDPSCCFGFYCKNPQEFEQFKQEGQKNFTPNQQSLSYPMCLILDGRSGDHHLNSPLSKTPGEEDTHASARLKNSIISLTDDDFSIDNFENISSSENSPQRTFESASTSNTGGKSPKKSETRGFSVNEMGERLNKLIPAPSKFYPKFMRQKSSSPVRKRKLHKEESLESQFELL